MEIGQTYTTTASGITGIIKAVDSIFSLSFVLWNYSRWV